MGLTKHPDHESDWFEFGKYLFDEVLAPPNAKSDNFLLKQRDSTHPNDSYPDHLTKGISSCGWTAHINSLEVPSNEKNFCFDGFKYEKLVNLQSCDPFCASVCHTLTTKTKKMFSCKYKVLNNFVHRKITNKTHFPSFISTKAINFNCIYYCT